MQRRFALIIVGLCICALASGIPLLYATMQAEIAVLALAIYALGFTLIGKSPRLGHTKLLDIVGVILIALGTIFFLASIFRAVPS